MRDARLTALHSVVFQMQLILPLAGSSPCRLYCSVIAVAVAVAVVDAVLLNLPSALPCGRRDGPGTVAYEDQQCQFEEKDPVLQRSSSALADQLEGSERIQHNGCRPARPLGAIFSSGSATDMFDSGGAACIRTRQSHFSRPQSGSRQKRYCPCCGFWQRVRTCTTSSSHWKAPSSAGCTAVKT